MPALKIALTFTLLVFPIALASQEPGRVYTAADYAQAEKFMPDTVNPLISHAVANPAWLADGRFWYRDTSPKGSLIILVDPVRGTRNVAFNATKLAAALQPFSTSPLDPAHPPIRDWSLADHDTTILLTFNARRFTCDLSAAGVCTPAGREPRAASPGDGPARVSPDCKKEAFIRNWNPPHEYQMHTSVPPLRPGTGPDAGIE